MAACGSLLRIGLVMLVSSVVLGDQATASDGFKSAAAQEAAAAYNSSLSRLTRECDEKIATARKTYVAALTAAKAKATKAGDLDEAIRIRDAIANLPSPAAHQPMSALVEARLALAERLAGTAWNQRGRSMIRFNSDGTVSVAGDKEGWRWVTVDAKTVMILYPSGWVNRFDFDANLTAFTDREFGKGALEDGLSGSRAKE